MSLQENLIALDSAVDRLSQGVNAIGLMSMGLVQVQDPYADGLCMLAGYMIEADREVRIHLDACLKAM